MRKTNKKLELNTVTVRELRTRLTDAQLEQAQGGRATGGCPDSSRAPDTIC